MVAARPRARWKSDHISRSSSKSNEHGDMINLRLVRLSRRLPLRLTTAPGGGGKTAKTVENKGKIENKGKMTKKTKEERTWSTTVPRFFCFVVFTFLFSRPLFSPYVPASSYTFRRHTSQGKSILYLRATVQINSTFLPAASTARSFGLLASRFSPLLVTALLLPRAIQPCV